MNGCKICGNRERNRLHTAREMAFGLREPFVYLECGQCGTLQLTEIPADMKKYYPGDYYSFQEHGRVKTFVRHQWSRYAWGGFSPVGWMFSSFFFPNYAMQAIRRAGVSKAAQILDVGCGSGRLLLDMAYMGFSNLVGADPFIARDLAYKNGVKVFKKPLNDISGQFDLIMLHHSYEHMDNPAEIMGQIGRLLRERGQAILRLPLASSYAWRHYGVNWVNLDAPRHFFLHTFKSMDLLTQQAGLEVQQVVHEGNDEQFWGSEQFAQDIPSNDPQAIGLRPLKRLLEWKLIRACKAKAEELNRKQQGDLVCFHLRNVA